MEEEQITLTSIERTAYWWIVTIKSKVRELSIFKCYSKEEEKFVSIFKNYTEVEWRILYLKLVEKISKDLDQYISEGRLLEFNQDTEREGHNLLNKELSSILGKKIPDISLSSDNAKDSVIYTTQANVQVWYKSSSLRPLSLNCTKNYILTGDERSLRFYYLLITTIAFIKQIDSDFNSVNNLREYFCKEYIRQSDQEESMEEIIRLFNKSFNKANDNEIIIGRCFGETYSAYIRTFDFLGLEDYFELAYHYANVIINESRKMSSSLNRIKPEE